MCLTQTSTSVSSQYQAAKNPVYLPTHFLHQIFATNFKIVSYGPPELILVKIEYNRIRAKGNKSLEGISDNPFPDIQNITPT